jgi:hypothetical protein
MQEVLSVNDKVGIKLTQADEVLGETVIRIRGNVVAELIGEDGKVKERQENHNMIVTQGKYGIADGCLVAVTIAQPTHMGLGSGAVAPALADTTVTALGTRVVFDTKTRSNNVVTFVSTFGAGNGTGAVTEAGIFNALTAGVMFSRVTFSVINKGANDTLQLTWTWTIG